MGQVPPLRPPSRPPATRLRLHRAVQASTAVPHSQRPSLPVVESMPRSTLAGSNRNRSNSSHRKSLLSTRRQHLGPHRRLVATNSSNRRPLGSSKSNRRPLGNSSNRRPLDNSSSRRPLAKAAHHLSSTPIHLPRARLPHRTRRVSLVSGPRQRDDPPCKLFVDPDLPLAAANE